MTERPLLTDLLPEDAARAVKRDYFLRLGTIVLIVLSLLLVAHGALLLPTYQYLTREVAERTARSTQMDEDLLTGGDQEASDALANIRADAAYLGRLSSLPAASGAIRLVLSVPHQGIVLTGFSYDAGNSKSPQKMAVTGTATTREALRNYNLALSSAPWAKNVDLPISAYAKEMDIPFTMTVTGSFISP